MTDELALLKELNTANKCPTCAGKGEICCIKPFSSPPERICETCPICHGTGAKVPELNRTEKIIVYNNKSEKWHSYPRAIGFREEGDCKEEYPLPTVEELLEMLPGSINHCGIEYYFTLLKSGNFYSASYYSSRVDAVQTIQFNFKSPLIACLRLLLWWIKQ